MFFDTSINIDSDCWSLTLQYLYRENDPDFILLKIIELDENVCFLNFNAPFRNHIVYMLNFFNVLFSINKSISWTSLCLNYTVIP